MQDVWSSTTERVCARACTRTHRCVTESASTWKADAFRPSSARLTPVHLTKVLAVSLVVKHLCASPGSHCQQWRRTSNSRRGNRLFAVMIQYVQEARDDHTTRGCNLLGGWTEGDSFYMASDDVMFFSDLQFKVGS